ncbi:MAG TPA: GNAT family N-acetyltransferase, partial [Chitinophagaceae bacterium]|nr:GNAT family N-acetyltransferase [Chitinophagaceae bacterium]
IPNQQLDKIKWDHCIDNASNGLIYAYSFYLDRMARNWDALVLDDYEAVMPLPWNRKFGISYIYQPYLTAQLGIFGNNLNEELTGRFIQQIPSRFRLVELSLNSGNLWGNPPGYSWLRNNYILSLDRPYDELYQGYRDNIKRNIRKSKQLGCVEKRDFDPEEVFRLALQQAGTYDQAMVGNMERIRDLYQFLHSRKMATPYGIFSSKNELLSSCIFFFSHGRAYYILVGNHPNGRTLGASHALIDAFIRDHAGQKMILDFEGSDIRNLAFFYNSFGAKQIVYPAIRINRLPFYLRWVKSS